MPILSQMNSVDILTFYLFMISFDSYPLPVVSLLYFLSPKSCMPSLLFQASYMLPWAHPQYLTTLIINDDKNKSRSSSFDTFISPSVTSFLIRQNVSAPMFWTSWCILLCSSIKMRDQVLHQQDKIFFFRILIRKLSAGIRKDKWLWAESLQTFPEFNLFLNYSWNHFDFLVSSATIHFNHVMPFLQTSWPQSSTVYPHEREVLDIQQQILYIIMN
jgi:hypothetical protein